MLKCLLWGVVMVLTVCGQSVFAQQTQISAQQALALFNEGEYVQALEMYERLLERNNRDHALNYYHGLILYKTNQRPDEALRRLRLAANRPPSPDVHFYLGKLYQRAYEPELAKASFERFVNAQRTENDMVQEANRAIEDSEASIHLINKYFDIQVIRKDTVPRNEMLKHYRLSSDAGRLMKAGDFFRVGVNPEQVIFRTERGDEVLFPILGRDGSYDLHKIVRLLDSWTDAEAFQTPVNSEYNDSYPFLLNDGVTLYFSSDRPGGMGGYDIYQTMFDPVTGTFSEPSNLGPPFNSPDDDFLLVPDVYEGKAWFASNRGVGDDYVIVTEIVWDNTVVRHFTEDVNQIRELATLPISESARSRASSTTYAGRDIQPTKIEEPKFRFYINDALVYSSYDQFVSQEALSSFKRGRDLELKRDSLNQRMTEMRGRYAQSYNQEELRRLIDNIIKLEREAYSLDDEINRHYLNARRLEQNKINELKARGEYNPSAVVQNKPDFVSVNKKALEDLNKSDFTFYSDDEFQKRLERLKSMYAALFADDHKKELLRSDSLYVWANILSLESARLLERTHNVEIEPVSLRDRISGNNNKVEEEIDFKVQSLRLQSRELKKRSLDLYELALDQKFSIYYPRAQEIGATSHRAGSENMLNQARSNFSEAEQSLRALHVYNPERIERLLALKRHGVDMMEEAFMMQLAGVPESAPVASSDRSSRFMDFEGAVTPSYPAIHRGSESLGATEQRQPPGELVSSAFGSNNRPAEPATESLSQAQQPNIVNQAKPEYRIQIGVFRNEPNADALSKIPPVTSEHLPDRGLSRYYSGSWRSHQEASRNVQSIIEAGFPGAFVVAFLNGELIPLERAKGLE